MPLLSDLQSALVLLALVWGISVLVRDQANVANTLHRTVIFAICALLALRYMVWRVTETVPASLGPLIAWQAGHSSRSRLSPCLAPSVLT